MFLVGSCSPTNPSTFHISASIIRPKFSWLLFWSQFSSVSPFTSPIFNPKISRNFNVDDELYRHKVKSCNVEREKKGKETEKPYRLTDLLLWVCQRHFELLLLLEMDVNCDPTHPRSSFDLIWITSE